MSLIMLIMRVFRSARATIKAPLVPQHRLLHTTPPASPPHDNPIIATAPSQNDEPSTTHHLNERLPVAHDTHTTEAQNAGGDKGWTSYQTYMAELSRATLQLQRAQAEETDYTSCIDATRKVKWQSCL